MKWNDVSKLKPGTVVGRFNRRGILQCVLIVLEKPKPDRRLGETLRTPCFDLMEAEVRMADQHELSDFEKLNGRN